MGDVFLSRELGEGGLTRRVAIKRIRPELAQDEHFRDLFRREARVALRMSHPNIVHVYEVGGGKDDLHLVMEYVEGRTLHDLLNQAGRLGYAIPVEVTLAIGLDVARGLNYAHELRDDDGRPLEIVHRDLSPKNVLISLQGDAKILDFGVAKASIARDENEGFEVKGNPSYLSPEQARLELVDRRSDVFTLGILLWELTTGRRLFQIDDPLHALEVIGRVPVPSPSEFRPVPPGWEGVLRRALAAEREDRYPTARALQLDIEDVARSAGQLVSNLPVVATLAALFPEVALELEPQPEVRPRQPKVLVVDDEPNIVELITRALRRSFDVQTASSVDQALAILAEWPCDAVLSDERMPDKRGMELLTHVARTSPRTARIMITAHADTELMLQAINDGRVSRFMVKPFRPVDLLGLLEDALAERPRLDEGSGGGPARLPPDPRGDPVTWHPRSSAPPRKQVRYDEDEATRVSEVERISHPPAAALPWESLGQLAASVREGALSSELLVGVSDHSLGEEARAAVDWVIGHRLEAYWCHVEGRVLVVLLPGLTSGAVSELAEALRAAVADTAGAEVAFAMQTLAARDDLADVGRKVEAAALDAWQRGGSA